jgi:hypothetical protein
MSRVGVVGRRLALGSTPEAIAQPVAAQLGWAASITLVAMPYPDLVLVLDPAAFGLDADWDSLYAEWQREARGLDFKKWINEGRAHRPKARINVQNIPATIRTDEAPPFVARLLSANRTAPCSVPRSGRF